MGSAETYLLILLQSLQNLFFSTWSQVTLSVGLTLCVLLCVSLAFWKHRVYYYNQFFGIHQAIHQWVPFETSTQPKYCSACRQLVSGFWIYRNVGWECGICGRTAHLKCLAACDNLECKTPCQPVDIQHQFVAGNLRADSVCCVCGIVCSSSFGLNGLRCLWCHRTVHEECSGGLPARCDLGSCGEFILPPHTIILALNKKPRKPRVSSKYVENVSTQLKTKFYNMQEAMSTGLILKIQEVSEGVKRLNEVLRHKLQHNENSSLISKLSKDEEAIRKNRSFSLHNGGGKIIGKLVIFATRQQISATYRRFSRVYRFNVLATRRAKQAEGLEKLEDTHERSAELRPDEDAVEVHVIAGVCTPAANNGECNGAPQNDGVMMASHAHPKEGTNTKSQLSSNVQEIDFTITNGYLSSSTLLSNREGSQPIEGKPPPKSLLPAFDEHLTNGLDGGGLLPEHPKVEGDEPPKTLPLKNGDAKGCSELSAPLEPFSPLGDRTGADSVDIFNHHHQLPPSSQLGVDGYTPLEPPQKPPQNGVSHHVEGNDPILKKEGEEEGGGKEEKVLNSTYTLSDPPLPPPSAIVNGLKAFPSLSGNSLQAKMTRTLPSSLSSASALSSTLSSSFLSSCSSSYSSSSSSSPSPPSFSLQTSLTFPPHSLVHGSPLDTFKSSSTASPHTVSSSSTLPTKECIHGALNHSLFSSPEVLSPSSQRKKTSKFLSFSRFQVLLFSPKIPSASLSGRRYCVSSTSSPIRVQRVVFPSLKCTYTRNSAGSRSTHTRASRFSEASRHSMIRCTSTTSTNRPSLSVSMITRCFQAREGEDTGSLICVCYDRRKWIIYRETATPSPLQIFHSFEEKEMPKPQADELAFEERAGKLEPPVVEEDVGLKDEDKEVTHTLTEISEEKSLKQMYSVAKRMPVQAHVWSISEKATLIGRGPGSNPVLVFVNVKSGGQTGTSIKREFLSLLNPLQVVDIKREKGPRRALEMFKPLILAKKIRVVVCGGDGTVGWVINELFNLYDEENAVPLAILPLGTGNDLSQMFGWGTIFNGDIRQYLYQVSRAQLSLLDVWLVKATNSNGKEMITTFQNYLDVGILAKLALKFHLLREAHPELFQSRIGNKFLYGEVGIREFIINQSVSLKGVRVWCDGEEVKLPDQVEDICVINISSFAGGVNLWRDNEIIQSGKQPVEAEFLSPKRCYSWSGKIDCYTEEDEEEEGILAIEGGANRRADGRQEGERSKQGCVQRQRNLPAFPVTSKSVLHTMSSFQPPESRASHLNFGDTQGMQCFSQSNSAPKVSEQLEEYYTRSTEEFIESNLTSSFSTKRRIGNNFSPSRSRWKKQSMRDQIIEVVAFKNLFHAGQVQVGLAAPLRVCQGREITLEIPEATPLQIDGEPQLIHPCSIRITHKFQATMLTPSDKLELGKSAVFREVLDNAVRKEVISSYQRNALIKELSARL